MALYLLIPLAGALGALCRWTCVRALTALGTGAPWGTLAVNLLGSFLAGLLYAPLRAHHPLLAQVLFLGFLGAFTTFSTYTLETATLILNGHLAKALLNLALQNGLGLLAALAGLLLTSRP